MAIADDDMSVSGISVVIPVFNGEDTIAECLNSVMAQTYQGPFEVLVVDNGSTDRTRQILASYSNIEIVCCRRVGAGAARNAGTERARHGFIAFIDCDCVADRDWLTNLMRSMREDLAGVGGAVLSRNSGSIETMVSAWSFDQGKGLARKPPSLITANCLLRRRALEGVSGFDERFTVAAAEDTDLSWRISEAGGHFGYAPDAICFHRHPGTAAQLLRQRFKYGYGRALLQAKYSGTPLDRLTLERSRVREYARLCRLLAQQLCELSQWKMSRQVLLGAARIGFFLGWLFGGAATGFTPRQRAHKIDMKEACADVVSALLLGPIVLVCCGLVGLFLLKTGALAVLRSSPTATSVLDGQPSGASSELS